MWFVIKFRDDGRLLIFGLHTGDHKFSQFLHLFDCSSGGANTPDYAFSISSTGSG